MKRRRRIILVVTLFSVIIFIIFLICRKGEGTDGRIDAERKQTHKPIEASDISKLPEVSEISEPSDSQQTEESSKEPITAAEDLSSETWETSEPEQTDTVLIEPEPEPTDIDPVESESAESEPAESESLIPETPEADSSERESEDPVLSEEGSETSVCLHEWIDITETIFHPEQGHYEEIILEEAYDEIRDIVEERRSEKCRCRCGAIFDSDTEWENHSIAHADDEEDNHSTGRCSGRGSDNTCCEPSAPIWLPIDHS